MDLSMPTSVHQWGNGMIKKIVAFFLVVCFLVIFVSPGMAQSGSGLRITGSSAEMDFPTSLDFRISAQSDVDITDIRLSYLVERLEHVQIVTEIYVEFERSHSVTTGWLWDMRRTGGLPSGSAISYWWTITDAAGEKVETPPARVLIEDNRYNWRSITEGMVTLYWYQGNESFASELMEATQDALSRLAENSGAELEEPVSLYIYASSSDLRGSMIFPQEWTGGVAFTQYGIVAIGIGPSSSQVEWGKRAISHELTHLVIHQTTFNPYNQLPVWLDEGLAMTSEGGLESRYVSVISEAISQDSLISVRSLASPFSAFSDVALLSYAQSYMIVDYLINEYGRDKMFELLSTFRQGSGYDEALLKVYGFDMDGLDTLWRASLKGMAIPQ